MRPPVWVLGLVLLVLVIAGITEKINKPASVPYSDFLYQLDAGNVASVTFRGTRIDGRFKHPIGETASTVAAQSNIFRSQVPDFGDPTLMPELRKEHVAIDVITSSNWVAWFGRLPWPMLVFLVAVLVAGFARLVRGRKAQSNAAMPMHPMQGMFGLLLALFGKKQLLDPMQHGGDEAKSG
jgi:ATP-dependent Zn protease